MSPTTYEELLSFVAPIIVKLRTTMRDPVSPSERLAVTLRFLVTGDAQCTIAASYRISASTISRIISETCAAIWTSLKERNFLHVPSEKQEWKAIAKEFENMWNFPHAIGAIDGKHIVMQAPHNGVSE
nr:putative nuclease HARBI1 [Hydra vulgaris]